MSNKQTTDLPAEWESLIQKYIDADISSEEFAQLEVLLKEREEVRDRYFAATRTAGLLREIAGKESTLSVHNEPASQKVTSFPAKRVATLSIAAGLVLFLSLTSTFFNPPVAAHLGESSNAVWLSETSLEGDKFRTGTRLHLASGSAELIFKTGATTRLKGPALFDLESSNGGYLHYGEAYSIADTEASEGFTIRTNAGSFIDRGTEFMTTASLDGFSQMLVASGAVEVSTGGFEQQRVETGNGFHIESGAKPILIRIERGTETPDFIFPTIPPPSDQDFADANASTGVTLELDSIGEEEGKKNAAPNSAPPSILFDGKAQANHDDPTESFFFRDSTTGYLLFDLGSTKPVSEIMTYSWHRNRMEPEKTMRAVQRFTLWGCRNERPSTLPGSEHSAGWTRIARVDTDAFFHVKESPDRPPQQACHIFSNTDSLGEFRYLLFEVLPTSTYDDIAPRHTFFSEIDIFTSSE